ncbi:MAG: hypothetical protein MET45_25450 [Nostoc sp. LLA-1]|nr:hypothetical protein [Cyanocohniella sp. LLY]
MQKPSNRAYVFVKNIIHIPILLPIYELIPLGKVLKDEINDFIPQLCNARKTTSPALLYMPIRIKRGNNCSSMSGGVWNSLHQVKAQKKTKN